MEKKQKKQLVMVLGATGCLGQAVACQLAEQGADLILVGRSSDKLEKVALSCEAFGAHCVLVPMPFTALVQLDELAVHMATRYGYIDGFISCLGYGASLGPLHMVSEKEWATTLMVNVTLNWKALQSFTSLLSKSDVGLALFPLESHWLNDHAYGSVYGLTKKTMAHMVQQFKLDNTQSTVRADIIALPFINSPLIDKMFPGLQGTLMSPQNAAKIITKGL